MKKIIPSICMLLVTAVLMGTSTYAWFSMNKTVTATGMKVKASTSSNLIISANKIENFDSTNNEYELNFNDGDYTSLTPVSSANGKVFYVATEEADKPNASGLKPGAQFKAQGKAAENTTTYWVTKTAHIGVKGVNPFGALSVNAEVTHVGTVNDKTKAIYKALRIAVYYNQTAVNNAAVIFGGETTTITTWAAANGEGAVATSTENVSTVNESTAIAGLSTLEVNKDYEITIVIWLEGQDTNCFADNTNAAKDLEGVTISLTFTAA